MTIYSVQFAAVQLTANSNALWTAETQFLEVVRDVEIVDRSGNAGNTVTLWLGVPGTATAFLNTPALGAYGHFQWQGRLVLASSQVLGASCGAFPSHVIVSGYRLTL